MKIKKKLPKIKTWPKNMVVNLREENDQSQNYPILSAENPN
jgi:hypothetical protein